MRRTARALLALLLVGGVRDACSLRGRASSLRSRAVGGHSMAIRKRGRDAQRERPQEEAEESAYWPRWTDWMDSQGPSLPPIPDPPLSSPAAESAVALGALASTAIISEGIQLLGTGGLIFLAKEFAGASDLPGAVDNLSAYFQGLGLAGYALYGAIMAFLQVIPLASAFVLTLSSGVIFGSTAKATALVSVASTTSAAIAFVIARYLLRDKLLEIASDNKTVLALDRALSKADFRTALLVIVLLRSSPLLPFSWASYLFGARARANRAVTPPDGWGCLPADPVYTGCPCPLACSCLGLTQCPCSSPPAARPSPLCAHAGISTVPFSAYLLGSWIGTLPAIFAYVQVGELGSEAALSGHPPSWLVGFGIAATVGAITLVGDLASKTLRDLDIDLQD